MILTLNVFLKRCTDHAVIICPSHSVLTLCNFVSFFHFAQQSLDRSVVFKLSWGIRGRVGKAPRSVTIRPLRCGSSPT